jgi:tetratricopeptide (TPR) repeat protein
MQSESFAVLFFSVMFAFLLKQTTDEALVRWYIYLVISSFALVTIGALFMIGGVPVFPGRELGRNFFPVGTSTDVLAVLVAIMWLVAWGVRLGVKQPVFLRLLDVCLVVFLLGLAVLDRPKAFGLLLGGMAILAFIHWRSKQIKRIYSWLLIGSIGSILFLALPVQSWVSLPVNSEVVLPSATGLTVVGRTLENSPVFGSGPGTFYYDFVKYRPAAFESLPIGDLRFVRPDSGWVQLISTYGLVGLGFFVASLVIAYTRRRPVAKLGPLKRQISIGLPVYWILIWLVLGMFLTSGSMVYTVLFWAALGLTVSGSDLSKPQSRLRLPIFRTIMVGSFLVMIFGWYFIGRIWGAPIAIASVNRSIKSTAPIEQVGRRLGDAIRLDPWNSGYRVKHAEYQLVVLQLTKKEVSTAESDSVIADLDEASQLDPRNPAVAERSIQIINQLRSVRPDLAERMLQRFGQLILLEPNSANDLVEWGKAELIIAQQSDADGKITVDQTLAQSALGHLATALVLKPGDLDARYHQAIAHELLGDRAVAKGIMRELAIQYPNEADLLYELARQERLDENNDEAMRLLDRAQELAPQSLVIQAEKARVYEAKGDKAKTLEILKAIEKASPDATSITDWIKRLEGEVPSEAAPTE